jgi:hypothetical protein
MVVVFCVDVVYFKTQSREEPTNDVNKEAFADEYVIVNVD